MLRGPVAETVLLSTLSAVIVAAMAMPVLRAPSERIFGMETVGRHHDPFTAMEQFAHPAAGAYSQPITDSAGAVLAKVAGPVAAYNWLVLISFPLSAAAAYALARYLRLTPFGAAVAALCYAFSPFHLTHAAYHPHIAQTEWLPLYLLALWYCLDVASPAAVAALAAATLAVVLSNFYAGLIAAVVTPVAVAGYWLTVSRTASHSARRAGITLATLALLAAAGVWYASHAAHDVFANRDVFAFIRGDLFRYGATWWSYLMPPVEHPLLGDMARRVWTAAGVREGLLEQQVSLGWGVMALGAVAVAVVSGARGAQLPSRSRVPVLIGVAVAAFVCSLAPEQGIGPVRFAWPSALLYDVLPMFRAYARFGVVVQLMAALLAGIGVDALWRAQAGRAQVACVALLALAACEYMVWPPALSRDVLPTTAHRWLMRQPGRVRAVDCAPLGPASDSLIWLSHARTFPLGDTIDDCDEPDIAQRLAVFGYTHMLVRRDVSAAPPPSARLVPDGLRLVAEMDDGLVFVVAVPNPLVYTAAMPGFFPREHDADLTWRWMGASGAWTVVNTATMPVVADINIDVQGFRRERRIELRLDGRSAGTFTAGAAWQSVTVGPLDVRPGPHVLEFLPADGTDAAGPLAQNNDPRELSLAIGAWIWRVRSTHP